MVILCISVFGIQRRVFQIVDVIKIHAFAMQRQFILELAFGKQRKCTEMRICNIPFVMQMKGIYRIHDF